MKKLRWFCLALCIGTIFAGCSRSGAVSDKQEAEENVSMGEEYHFPEKYGIVVNKTQLFSLLCSPLRIFPFL